MTGELKRGLILFGTALFRRILCYRWHEYMSNDLVHREAGLRQVTCIGRERQLRLYAHVARRPEGILPMRSYLVGIRGARPSRRAARVPKIRT